MKKMVFFKKNYYFLDWETESEEDVEEWEDVDDKK